MAVYNAGTLFVNGSIATWSTTAPSRPNWSLAKRSEMQWLRPKLCVLAT
jgi:hypothetical protein